MRVLWIIPILNIVAFLLAIFFGKKVSKGKAHVWTIPFMFVSWIIAIVAFMQNVFGHPEVLQSVAWFDIGVVSLRMGVLVDGFAAAMAVVVTTITLMVEIYSVGYMRGEIRYVQYTATLPLFAAGMLVLILADNLFLGIFGWEIMGLTSYLLISHYFEDKANSNAGIKAFLTTRVGDLGLLTGAIVCFWGAGTFSFEGINLAAITGEFGGGMLIAAAILLFVGVIGKSAQVPLHTWLPDAMAGPTPVSALIHAATMVVAGVYLVGRLYGVFVEAFEIANADFQFVVIVGAVTAIVGALLALVQFDLKKVLAYSTISQLGYMIFALGVGAWGAGIFHLFTHAFFKALLFLGAGSVIHAVHHVQDMRYMGGLRKKMPITYVTWLLGTLALSGVFPLAGFFSKDEILAGAFANEYEWAWAVGLAVAFLTAFYMFRATHMVFHGKYRGEHEADIHESEPLMTGPLVFLAIPTVAIGFLGLPGNLNLFEGWIETGAVKLMIEEKLLPHAPDFGGQTLYLAGASLVTALAGIAIATVIFYYKKGSGTVIENNAFLSWWRNFIERKFYLDDIYGGIVYAIREPLAQFTYWTNMAIIDKVLDLAGVAAIEAGRGVYWVDQNVIDSVYDGTAYGTDRVGEAAKQIQSGKVQQYAGVLFIGAALLGVIVVAFR